MAASSGSGAGAGADGGGGVSGVSRFTPSFSYTAYPDMAGTTGYITLAYKQRYDATLPISDVSGFKVIQTQFPTGILLDVNSFHSSILTTTTDSAGRKYSVADISVNYIWIITTDITVETTFTDGSTKTSTVKRIIPGGIISDTAVATPQSLVPTLSFNQYDASGILQILYTQEYSYDLTENNIARVRFILEKTQTYVGDPNPQYITDVSGSVLINTVDLNLNNIAQTTLSVPFYHNMSFNIWCITTFTNGNTSQSLPTTLTNSYTHYKDAAQANPPRVVISNVIKSSVNVSFDVSYSIILRHFMNQTIPDYGSIDRVIILSNGTAPSSSLTLTFSQDSSGNYIGTGSGNFGTGAISANESGTYDYTIIIRTIYRDNTEHIYQEAGTIEDSSNYLITLTSISPTTGTSTFTRRVKSMPTYNIRDTDISELHIVNPLSLHDISFGSNTIPAGCKIIADMIPYLSNATCEYQVPSGTFSGGRFIDFITSGSATIKRIDITQPISLIDALSGSILPAAIKDYSLSELFISNTLRNTLSFSNNSLSPGCKLLFDSDKYLTNTTTVFTVPSSNLVSNLSVYATLNDIITSHPSNFNIQKTDPSANSTFVIENNDILDLTHINDPTNPTIIVRSNNLLRNTTITDIYLPGNQYATVSFLQNSLPSGCKIKVENNDWVDNAVLIYTVPLSGNFAGGIFKFATDPRYSTYAWYPLTFEKKISSVRYSVKSAIAWPSNLFRDASGLTEILIPAEYASTVNGNYIGVSFGLNSLPPNCQIISGETNYISNAYSIVSTPSVGDFTGGTVPEILGVGPLDVSKIDNSQPYTLKSTSVAYQIPANYFRAAGGLTDLSVTASVYGFVTFGSNALPPGCIITAPVPYLVNTLLTYTVPPSNVSLPSGYIHEVVNTGHPITLSDASGTSTKSFMYRSPFDLPANSILRYSDINEYIIDTVNHVQNITIGATSLPANSKIVLNNNPYLSDCVIKIIVPSGNFAGGSISDIMSSAPVTSVIKNAGAQITIGSIPDYAFSNSDLSGTTVKIINSTTTTLGKNCLPPGCIIVSDVNDYLTTARLSYTVPAGEGLKGGQLYDSINTGTSIYLTETFGRSYFTLVKEILPANCFLRNCVGLSSLYVLDAIRSTVIFGANSLPIGCRIDSNLNKILDTYLDNAKLSFNYVVPENMTGGSFSEVVLGSSKTIIADINGIPIQMKSGVTNIPAGYYRNTTGLSSFKIPDGGFGTVVFGENSLPINCEVYEAPDSVSSDLSSNNYIGNIRRMTFITDASSFESGTIYDIAASHGVFTFTKYLLHVPYTLKSNVSTIPSNSYLRRSNIDVLQISPAGNSTAYPAVTLGQNALPAGCQIRFYVEYIVSGVELVYTVPNGSFSGGLLSNLQYTMSPTTATLKSDMSDVPSDNFLNNTNINRLIIPAGSTTITLEPRALPINCLIGQNNTSQTKQYTTSDRNTTITRIGEIYYSGSNFFWIPDTLTSKTITLPNFLSYFGTSDYPMYSLPNGFTIVCPSNPNFIIGTDYSDTYTLNYYGISYSKTGTQLSISNIPTDLSGSIAIPNNIRILPTILASYVDNNGVPKISNLIISPLNVFEFPYNFNRNFNRNQLADGQIYSFGNLTWRNSRSVGGTRITDMGFNPIKYLMPGAFDLYNSQFKDLSALQAIVISDMTTITANVPAEFCKGCSSLIRCDIRALNVGANAFNGCGILSSGISFGDTRSIGASAFQDCSQLRGVTIQSRGNLVIEPAAFSRAMSHPAADVLGCPISLTTQGDCAIGSTAFLDCSESETLLISTTGTSNIGQFAFSGCKSLHTATVRSTGNCIIGGSAFAGCTNLQTLMIDCSGACTIAATSFTGCTSLKTVTLLIGGNLTFSTNTFRVSPIEKLTITNINSASFNWASYQNSLTSLKNITLSIAPSVTAAIGTLTTATNLETVMITGGAMTLAENAFQGCSKLHTVIISSIIQNTAGVSVPTNAFTGCSALTSVNLSLTNSAATACNSSFSGITSLTSISITGGRVALPANSFSGCSKLNTLTLNCSLTNSFDSTAFQGCTMLSTLTLPFAIDAVASFAAPLNFYTLLQTVSLTGGVTVTPTNFLQGCSSLRNLTINGVLAGALDSTIMQNLNNLILRTSTVQTIAPYSYMNNTNFRNIDISPIDKIGKGAFFGCTNLKMLVLSEGLTAIGDWAFANTGISGEVVIPSTVVSLGNAYFVGCPHLRKLTYRCPVLMFQDPTQISSDMWNVIHQQPTITLDISGITVLTKGEDPSLNITYIDSTSTSHTLSHSSLYSNLNLEKYNARATAFEQTLSYIYPLYNIVSEPSNNQYDLSSSLIVGTQIEKLRDAASKCKDTTGPVANLTTLTAFNTITSSFSDITTIAAAVGQQSNIASAAIAFGEAIIANTNMYSSPADPTKVLSVPVPMTLPSSIRLPLQNINLSRIIGENLIDICNGVLYARYNVSNMIIHMYDSTTFDISGTATLNIDEHLGTNAATIMKYLFIQDNRLNNYTVNFSFTGALTSIYLLDDKNNSNIDISSQTVIITDLAMDMYTNSSVSITAAHLKIYNNAFNKWNTCKLTISTSNVVVGKDIFMGSKELTINSNKPLVNTPQIQMIDFGGSSSVLDISSIIWEHTGVPEAKIRDLTISTYIPKENPGYVRGYCIIKFQDLDTLKEHALIAQPEDWFWCYRGIFNSYDFDGGPKDDKYNITNTGFKYVNESSSGLTNSFAPDVFTYNGYRFTRKITSSRNTNNNVLLRAVKTDLSQAKATRAKTGILLSLLLIAKDIALGIAFSGLMVLSALPGAAVVTAPLMIALIGAQITLSLALTSYITHGKFRLSSSELDATTIAVEVVTSLVGGAIQIGSALRTIQALKVVKASSSAGAATILVRTTPQAGKITNVARAALEKSLSSISDFAKKSVRLSINKIKKLFSQNSTEISSKMVTEGFIPNPIQFARAASMKGIPVAPISKNVPATVRSAVTGRAAAAVRSKASIITKPIPKMNAIKIDKGAPTRVGIPIDSKSKSANLSYFDDGVSTINPTTAQEVRVQVKKSFGPMQSRFTPRRNIITLIEDIATEAFNNFGTDSDSIIRHPNWSIFLEAALQRFSLSSDSEDIDNAISFIYRLLTADYSSAYDANVDIRRLMTEDADIASAYNSMDNITLHQLVAYNTIVTQPSIAVTETLGYNTIIDDDMETAILTAGQADIPPYIFPMVSEESAGSENTEDKIYYYYRYGTKYQHKNIERNNSGYTCSVITTANPLLTINNYMWKNTHLGNATTPGGVERNHQGYVTDANSIINRNLPAVILGINEDNDLLYLGNRKVEYVLSDYEMPNNVFCGVENMTVIIPEGVTDISSYAFCSTDGTDGEIPFSIDTLVLPSTIQRINYRAFYRAGVKNVFYPANIKYIGRSVFENCGLMNALAINNELDFTTAQMININTLPTTEIIHDEMGRIIFRNFNTAIVTTAAGSRLVLTGNTSINEPNTIWITPSSNEYEIQDNLSSVFTPPMRYTWLNPITVSSSSVVVKIGNVSYFSKNVSNNTLTIVDKSYPEFGCLIFKNGEQILTNIIPDNIAYGYRIATVSLTENNIFVFRTPTRITYGTTNVITRNINRNISETSIIEPDAFAGNTTLEAVSFPDNTVSIGSNAFAGCTALTSVDIPNTVTEIQEAAFANSGLKTVVIPPSVTTVGSNIFQGVSDELNVVFTDETPPPSALNIISQLPPTTTIIVPATAVNTFTPLVVDTTISVLADAPAGAPTNVSVSSANQSLVVSWNPPTTTGGSPITSYTLYYTPTGGSQITLTNASNPQTIVGLTNRTVYSVQVVAMKPIGAGTPSTPVLGTPLPNGPTSFTNLLPGTYADGNGGVRYFTHYFDVPAGSSTINIWGKSDSSSNSSIERLYTATSSSINLLDISHITVATDASLNNGVLTLTSNLNNTTRNHNLSFNNLQATTRYYIISKTTNDVSGQELCIALQTLAGVSIPITFIKTARTINNSTNLVSATDTSLNVFTIDGITISDGSTLNIRNKTSVSVVATPSDPDAIVSISGNTGLIDGSNNLFVTVTAADGITTKLYTVLLTVLQNTISSTSQISINALAAEATSTAIQAVAANVLSDIAANSSNKATVISNFISTINASTDIDERSKVATALSVAMKVPVANNTLKQNFNTSFKELGLIENTAYDLEAAQATAAVSSVESQFKRPGYNPTNLAIIIPNESTTSLTIDLNKGDLVLSFVPGVSYTVNALYGNTLSSNSYTVIYTRNTTQRYLTVNGSRKTLDSTFTFDFTNAISRYVKIEVTGSIIISNGPVETNPICFLGNAPVLTPSGYRRIDSLQTGDMIKTADGRIVAIQRIKTVVAAPGAMSNPYIIPAGYWGATTTLAISPRHRIAVPGRGMVEACDLGLKQLPMREHWIYYNVSLPNWETDNLVVAGVEVESLAPVERVRMTLGALRTLLVKKYGTAAISKEVVDRVLATCRLGADGLVEAPVIRKRTV